MSVPPGPAAGQASGSSHGALAYCGTAEFLAGAMWFSRPAVAAGDPVLAVLSGPKTELIRGALGPDAGLVGFADMAEVGSNPARITGAWHRFVGGHPAAARLDAIGEAMSPDRHARPLPARPAHATGLAFQRGGLGYLRAYVGAWARGAGLAERPATALVTAVNEIATNSLRHGGGQGELRVWTDGSSLLCEVTDQGQLTAPLAGRLPPEDDDGAGLWLANQLADLVQIHSAAGGTAVRIHQRL
jgi:anti-sigma regulatory factor (Ser/Thr protein kinase)